MYGHCSKWERICSEEGKNNFRNCVCNTTELVYEIVVSVNRQLPIPATFFFYKKKKSWYGWDLLPWFFTILTRHVPQSTNFVSLWNSETCVYWCIMGWVESELKPDVKWRNHCTVPSTKGNAHKCVIISSEIRSCWVVLPFQVDVVIHSKYFKCLWTWTVPDAFLG